MNRIITLSMAEVLICSVSDYKERKKERKKETCQKGNK